MGVDSTPASGTVTFAAGSNTATFSVNTVNDNTFESVEGLKVSLFDGNTSVGTSTMLLISDAATYAIAAASSSVDEGGTAKFIVTTNVADGTIGYTISGTGITAADTTDGKLTGTATITSGVATISVPLSLDKITEGMETLRVTLADGITFATIAVNDTSLNERTIVDLSTGTVAASANAEAFVYDYKMVNGRATKAGDGLVTITGFDPAKDKLVFNDVGTGTFYTKEQFIVLPGVAASDNPFTGEASIIFDPDAGVLGGVTLTGVTTSSIAIETMSSGSGPAKVTYAVAAGAASYNEGTTASFGVTTTNVANGTVLNYTLSGTGITSADITGGALAGTVTINNNIGTISVPLAADATTEGNETLTVTVNGKTASTTIVDTSVPSGFLNVDLSTGTVAGTANAEAFVYDYKMVNGRATKAGDGLVTITGFDPAKDKLVFNDVGTGTFYTKEQFIVLPGVAASDNPFTGEASIIFDPDAGVLGGVTLTGVTTSSIAIETLA